MKWIIVTALALGLCMSAACAREAQRRVVVVEPPPREALVQNQDRDGDGVFDTEDMCPDDPEDRDTFEDRDGCPDADNDGDGLPDTGDKCPNDPEDRDGFEDEDGCPDPDNDRDGVLDGDDRCPNTPGDKGHVEDGDGCPTQRRLPIPVDRIEIRDMVHFAPGASRLTRHGLNVIESLAEALKAYQSIEVVEVRGHVDASEARGRRAEALSLRRAEVVYEALVGRGIEPARLKVSAFGAQRPHWETRGLRGVALKEARSRNRRVSFKILKLTAPRR